MWRIRREEKGEILWVAVNLIKLLNKTTDCTKSKLFKRSKNFGSEKVKSRLQPTYIKIGRRKPDEKFQKKLLYFLLLGPI